ERPGLAARGLGGRRVGLGARLVRDARAVAERPDVLVAVYAQRCVGSNAPALVERQAELRELRARLDARRPDQRVRRDPLAVREGRGVLLDRLERRLDVDLEATSRELAGRV